MAAKGQDTRSAGPIPRRTFATLIEALLFLVEPALERHL